MKKRIAKITALLLSAALLTLPGAASSVRQTTCAASVHSANNYVDCPIPVDVPEYGAH